MTVYLIKFKNILIMMTLHFIIMRKMCLAPMQENTNICAMEKRESLEFSSHVHRCFYTLLYLILLSIGTTFGFK